MIFPQPIQETYFDGTYILKEKTGRTSLLAFYEDCKSGNTDLACKWDMTLGPEEYAITVNADGITVTSSTEQGKYRALTSLRQIIDYDRGCVPFCDVQDRPEFQNRAYMLDISRCRMPKPERIKKLIDHLSELKYNEFQLYMENFSFKFSAYPQYTADYDCLTPEDIRELDEYCAQRFIVLTPNMNCFGHMKAWLAQPEFAHLEVGYPDYKTGTLNPLLDETLELIDNIFASLLPHFRSKYVTINMDEAYGLGKYQLEQICKEKGPDNVFMDYLEKINDLAVNKYGKHVFIANDMIANYPDSFKRVPEGTTVLAWGYDLIEDILLEKRCHDLKEKNVRTYVCAGNAVWLSFTGRFDVTTVNLRSYAEIGRKYGAAGFIVCDWGCGEGHMHNPVWSLVPGVLAAQYAWNAGVEQNGGMLKNDFVYLAEQYVDKHIFKTRVANLVSRMQNYFFLEPLRIHSSTMCCLMFRKPLSQSRLEGWFDLDEVGDDFYFDNVIWYMQRCLEELEKVENLDEEYRRQIVSNARMVILAQEFMKIRTHHGVDNKTARRLITMIDEIYAEHRDLWLTMNYEKGIEDFLGQLDDKKQELLCMMQ